MGATAGMARAARRVALLLLALLTCQGCAYWNGWRHTYSDRAVPAQTFHFRDGGHAIYFSFDKSVQQWPATAEPAIATYLFVIAGSDCTSMKYFLPQYFDGLDGRSGAVRIFVLHKRFIGERSWGRIAGCGEAFVRADHPQRWLADQREFIEAQLARAGRAGTPPVRVALLGISEGGDIVPTLAARIAAATHVAILGNGGMAPLAAYRLQAQRQGFAAHLAALDALDGAPPADPDDPAQGIAGRSWRYWKELRELPHQENLLRLQLPLLVAMGEADDAVPVESARYLRSLYAAAGKQNLTLLLYPQADHGLHDGRRSRLVDFFRAFDEWLEK